jgi:dolichol kinase
MTYLDELQRKTIHISSLSIPIGYYFLPYNLVLAILVPVTALFFLVDILRLHIEPVSKIFYKFFGYMLREHETKDKRFTGATYVVTSDLLCIVVFGDFFDQKFIAIAAMCFMVISDTSAALIGRKFGKTKIFNKSLEGSIAFFVTSLIIVFVIPDLNKIAGIIGALVATIVEVLPLKIDDNFSIPISSASIMLLIVSII